MQVALANGSCPKAFSNGQRRPARRGCVAVRAEAVAIPTGFKKVWDASMLAPLRCLYQSITPDFAHGRCIAAHVTAPAGKGEVHA